MMLMIIIMVIMVNMVIMDMMIILMMMTVIRMEIRQIQHKYPSNQKKTGLKSLGLDDTKQNQYCLSSIKSQRPPGAWPKPERWKVSTAVNHSRRPVLVKGGQIMQMDEVALFGPWSDQGFFSTCQHRQNRQKSHRFIQKCWQIAKKLFEQQLLESMWKGLQHVIENERRAKSGVITCLGWCLTRRIPLCCSDNLLCWEPRRISQECHLCGIESSPCLGALCTVKLISSGATYIQRCTFRVFCQVLCFASFSTFHCRYTMHLHMGILSDTFCRCGAVHDSKMQVLIVQCSIQSAT